MYIQGLWKTEGIQIHFIPKEWELNTKNLQEAEQLYNKSCSFIQIILLKINWFSAMKHSVEVALSLMK